jgi:DNA-binding winged helix-turn-helix (wHTH) protein/tetratricopeptide (TPR) repeat protein
MGDTSVYRFAGLVFDAESGELLNEGETVRLQRAPLTVLLSLLRAPGQLVPREQLYEALWHGAAADHRKGLDTAVKKLRKMLGGRGRYIETVTGRGYRIIANVARIPYCHSAVFSTAAENCAYPKPPVRLSPTSPADQFFLRGFLCWHKRTGKSLRSALSLFARALELEPAQARHNAAIAVTWSVMARDGVVRPAEAIVKACEAAVQALRRDNANLLALCVLGSIRSAFEYDLAGGAEELRAVIAIEPRNPWACMPLSFALLAAGDFAEGLSAIRTAVNHDPVSPTLRAELAFAHYIARDCDEAARLGAAAVDRDPDFGLARFYHAHTLIALARYPEAVAHLRVAARAMSDSTDVRALLAMAQAFAGDRRFAEEAASDLALRAETGYVDAYYRALLLDSLGLREAAVRLLEQSCRDRCHWFALAAVDPKLDAMRGDSRVQELIARLLPVAPAAPVRQYALA